ncbi:MAG: sensor histidine kinase [Phenylobacterium sp.]|nr:sensor histidine kinase [Phenylobacterium sp.]
MLPAAYHAPDADPDALDEAVRSATARRDAQDEHKRSFLRMVSHELRTPLNSILGFSEILATELYGPLGDPQYKEYAEIIRGSGHKLLKLVNQVLEIARLEGGNADLAPAPELVAIAIDDVIDGLHDDAVERDIHLDLAGCDGAVVMADPRGLRTVLGNLLQNAIGFSPEGGEVRVSASRQGKLVEIIVANDGDGVEASELPRLLRPFEQGENALTRHSEGAGLGLPICELTCQAMGGMLQLKSAPGRGFSAHVVLRAG